MERERLSRAYSVSSAAVKFYGSLSPDNSVSGSNAATPRCSVTEKEDVLGGMVQSRPFTTPAEDSHDNERTVKDGKGGDKGKKNKDMEEEDAALLNVSAIEQEVADALAADDAAAQHLQKQAEITVTQTGETVASYEDEFFYLRPKIVQVKMFMWH